jgi:hypothetical protein
MLDQTRARRSIVHSGCGSDLFAISFNSGTNVSSLSG